ncbi:MAG: hypothetical protein E6J34_23765 [Chloroflexi bacterium]|nr:MAG: hypothetical protein E6J34_23765 [Chloroflexota bacterium]
MMDRFPVHTEVPVADDLELPPRHRSFLGLVMNSIHCVICVSDKVRIQRLSTGLLSIGSGILVSRQLTAKSDVLPSSLTD